MNFNYTCSYTLITVLIIKHILSTLGTRLFGRNIHVETESSGTGLGGETEHIQGTCSEEALPHRAGVAVSETESREIDTWRKKELDGGRG